MESEDKRNPAGDTGVKYKNLAKQFPAPQLAAAKNAVYFLLHLNALSFEINVVLVVVYTIRLS